MAQFGILTSYSTSSRYISIYIDSLMWGNTGTQDVLHLGEPFSEKERPFLNEKEGWGARSSTEGEVPLGESSWSPSAFSHLVPTLLGLELSPLFLHPGPIPPVQVLDCLEYPATWGTTQPQPPPHLDPVHMVSLGSTPLLWLHSLLVRARVGPSNLFHLTF